MPRTYKYLYGTKLSQRAINKICDPNSMLLGGFGNNITSVVHDPNPQDANDTAFNLTIKDKPSNFWGSADDWFYKALTNFQYFIDEFGRLDWSQI